MTKSKKPNDVVEAFGGTQIDRKTLEDACHDLSGTVAVVSKLLEEVEKDLSKTQHFVPVSERLDKVKGDALQMNLTRIGGLAEVAEEIAIKGSVARERPVVRRVVGALWDAMTTLQHMLEHVQNDTTDEGDILMNRLHKTLETLGGARAKVGQDEIKRMFEQK